MTAGLVVIDPEVATERNGPEADEFQSRYEPGRGPVILLLHVKFPDRGGGSRVVSSGLPKYAPSEGRSATVTR
jgi:hypothetical protein